MCQGASCLKKSENIENRHKKRFSSENTRQILQFKEKK